MNNQLAQVLSAAIRAVESLRFRYALVGGLALAARGVIRATRPRDTDDLRRLLAASRGSLDLAYLRKWAAALDASLGSDEVSKRLADAIATVGTR